MLSDRRDYLVAARPQTVNRLHAALTDLLPGGAPAALTAQKAADLLRTVRPRELVAKTRRALASNVLADMRRLDDQLKTLDKQLTNGVKTSGSGLCRRGYDFDKYRPRVAGQRHHTGHRPTRH